MPAMMALEFGTVDTSRIAALRCHASEVARDVYPSGPGESVCEL
jgi:hypothetical protein